MPSKTAKRKRREKSEANGVLMPLLKSLAVGTVCLVVLLSISSAAAISTDASKKLYPVFALVCAAMSAFAGGFYAARKLRKRGLLTGTVSQLGLFAVITLVSLIINKSLGVTIFLLLAVTLVFGGVGGITAVNTKLRR